MDLEPLHISHGRPFSYQPDKFLHLTGGAFGDDLHGGIRQVADVPRQAVPFPNPLNEIPEAYPLHHAVNNDAPSQFCHETAHG